MCLPSSGLRAIFARLAHAMAILAVLTVSGFADAETGPRISRIELIPGTRPVAESPKALPVAVLREAQASKGLTRRTPGSADSPDAVAGDEVRNEQPVHFLETRLIASTGPVRSYYLAETSNNPRDPPVRILP